jgi:hypothetical protein
MKASRTPLEELLDDVETTKPFAVGKSGGSKDTPTDGPGATLKDSPEAVPKSGSKPDKRTAPGKDEIPEPKPKAGPECELKPVSPPEEPQARDAETVEPLEMDAPRSELDDELLTLETEIDLARAEKADITEAQDLFLDAMDLARKRPRRALALARRGMASLHEARDDRRKLVKRRKIALCIALLIIIPAVLYIGVIPRTELTVKVRYNEGLLNQINIAAELRNTGTIDAGSIKLEVSVVNSTDMEMGNAEYLVSYVGAHQSPHRLDTLTFRGNQLERYTVLIDLEFTSGSRTFSRHWSHNTDEPWINQDFVDTVSAI